MGLSDAKDAHKMDEIIMMVESVQKKSRTVDVALCLMETSKPISLVSCALMS